jgi:hypothetical protein
MPSVVNKCNRRGPAEQACSYLDRPAAGALVEKYLKKEILNLVDFITIAIPSRNFKINDDHSLIVCFIGWCVNIF